MESLLPCIPPRKNFLSQFVRPRDRSLILTREGHDRGRTRSIIMPSAAANASVMIFEVFHTIRAFRSRDWPLLTMASAWLVRDRNHIRSRPFCYAIRFKEGVSRHGRPPRRALQSQSTIPSPRVHPFSSVPNSLVGVNSRYPAFLSLQSFSWNPLPYLVGSLLPHEVDSRDRRNNTHITNLLRSLVLFRSQWQWLLRSSSTHLAWFRLAGHLHTTNGRLVAR